MHVTYEPARKNSPARYRWRFLNSVRNVSGRPIVRFPILMPARHVYFPPPMPDDDHLSVAEEFLGRMGLWATVGPKGEPAQFQFDDDGSTLWIDMKNPRHRFATYSGDESTIECGFALDEDESPQGLERVVHLPTRSLSLQLTLPAAREPTVSGYWSSLSARTFSELTEPVRRSDKQRICSFEWEVDNPPLLSHYEFVWRYKKKRGRPPRPGSPLDRAQPGGTQVGQ